MQKIACIFSFKMSSWVSCQKIVFNLHKSYQLHKDLELLNFNYSVDQTPHETQKTIQGVIEARPDSIVILDHKPHPLFLLQQILMKLDYKPRIIFHIFGDFTLYYQQWSKLAAILKGYEVDFIAASERQKHLIDKFLQPSTKCHVCPFPVDKHEFNYTPALRKIQREEWGLKEDDIAYVFTGRLSRQKRIHSLIKIFTEFLEKTKTDKAHLFLYGNPDHIGDQFVGKWEVEGQYFRKINKLYKSLPESAQKRIHFMGGVPNKELKSVYQGADWLVNLSVHNDEDYGMSVAEALCSGLPAILTDWGGLAGFYQPDEPDATKYIPVVIGKRNKLIDSRAVLRELESSLKTGHFKRRKELSELALSSLGVEAGFKVVTNVIAQKPQPFEAFTAFFNKVTDNVAFNQVPYLTDTKDINKIYREIYSSYVRHH